MEINPSPQNLGDGHHCGPKEWAACQAGLLRLILARLSEEPEEEIGRESDPLALTSGMTAGERKQLIRENWGAITLIAREVGMSVSSTHRIIYGERHCTPEVAHAIGVELRKLRGGDW